MDKPTVIFTAIKVTCKVSDTMKFFGVLKFSALRREVHVQNKDGTVSEEIEERTYQMTGNPQQRKDNPNGK